MRIIQISDTHLSPGKTHFGDNWAPLAAWIAELAWFGLRGVRADEPPH